MEQHIESIGFIGGGRVTRFLLEGWNKAGSIPDKILVSDKNPETLKSLKSDFPQIQLADNKEAAHSKLVILAVHPLDLKSVLEEIRNQVSAEAVVLSLAPKVTSFSIQTALGVRQVARMIPNAPSAIGSGYNPVAFTADVSPKCLRALESLFAAWGESPVVPEKDLEAYAILTAMGPTYMWFQWQVLRELAIEFGLPEETASNAILRMITGAAECLLNQKRQPAEVIDMIPVMPLKAEEEAIKNAYTTSLRGLYKKLSTA